MKHHNIFAILYNKYGFGIDYQASYIAGAAIGFACLGWLLGKKRNLKSPVILEE